MWAHGSELHFLDVIYVVETAPVWSSDKLPSFHELIVLSGAAGHSGLVLHSPYLSPEISRLSRGLGFRIERWGLTPRS